jgi:hypothetical protein
MIMVRNQFTALEAAIACLTAGEKKNRTYVERIVHGGTVAQKYDSLEDAKGYCLRNKQ